MRNAQRGDFFLPLLTVLLDALAIESAFLASYWLRFHTEFFDFLGFLREDAPPLRAYVLGSLFVILVWLLLFQSHKMYGVRRSVSLSDEVINVTKVVSIGMMLVLSAAFFYREFSYSRVVMALLWGSSTLFIVLARSAVHTYERYLYRRGRHLQQAIIIGNGNTASHIYERLHRHPAFGFDITGYFGSAPAAPDLPLAVATYHGRPETIPHFIRQHGIQLAFIAIKPEEHATLFELVDRCEGVNIEFMMVPDVLEILTSQARIREIDDIPFLKLKGIPLTTWGHITKRAFDLILSTTLLVLFSPLFLLLALLIKLDSRGPVLFRQRRVGLDGREFTMYKFRSMIVGAHQLDHEAGLGIRNDPRRTAIGRFLRKASLDELPQLINVVRGDMSLVGPRPERTQYVEQFQSHIPGYLDRHRVKTGVTGWAQVHGLRGDTSIEERIRYDLYYIENWSLGLDIKILLRTLRAAFRSAEEETP